MAICHNCYPFLNSWIEIISFFLIFSHFPYPSFLPSSALLSSLVSSFHIFSAVPSFYTSLPSLSSSSWFLIAVHSTSISFVCLYLFSLTLYFFLLFLYHHCLPPTIFSLPLFLSSYRDVSSFPITYICILQLCLKTLTF